MRDVADVLDYDEGVEKIHWLGAPLGCRKMEADDENNFRVSTPSGCFFKFMIAAEIPQ